ncbi:MAG TPA: radical SAM protein [Spirochaetota bacterium]|nr:radical SAM protein [Spirochaetota bacterium]
MTHPGFLTNADLGKVSEELKKSLSHCTICPFKCGTDRYREEGSRCRAGHLPKVASATLHHGEEPPISGTKGSGTIFFSSCGLRCLFCQNYPVSQMGNGNEMTVSQLAEAMLVLQRKKAHNINLVTPTHYTPQIVEALAVAKDMGLSIPIVYNSSGYERVETLRLLDGIVDIYLPDMKYGTDEMALRYSGAVRYVEINRRAVSEMYRQTGPLRFDDEGIATRGLLVRHLVLPGGISCTGEVLRWLSELSRDIPVSLMNQYFPAYRAFDMKDIGRKLRYNEYDYASRLLEKYGFSFGWTQEY